MKSCFLILFFLYSRVDLSAGNSPLIYQPPAVLKPQSASSGSMSNIMSVTGSGQQEAAMAAGLVSTKIGTQRQPQDPPLKSILKPSPRVAPYLGKGRTSSTGEE